jgi:hypothetical protein
MCTSDPNSKTRLIVIIYVPSLYTEKIACGLKFFEIYTYISRIVCILSIIR